MEIASEEADRIRNDQEPKHDMQRLTQWSKLVRDIGHTYRLAVPEFSDEVGARVLAELQALKESADEAAA